jgi:hypothetical protein
MSELSDAIWRLKDRLADPRRWIKYDVNLVDDDGYKTMCLLGARLDTLTDHHAWVSWHDSDGSLIEHVVNDDPVNQAVYAVIREQFGHRLSTEANSRYDTPYHLIPTFNDDEHTTHEDVMLVLEKAAIKADEVLQ